MKPENLDGIEDGTEILKLRLYSSTLNKLALETISRRGHDRKLMKMYSAETEIKF